MILKKLFIRVFLMAFLCFTLLFTGVFAAFNTFMQDSHPNADVPVIRDREDQEFDDQEAEPFERDQLRRLVNKSNRVNAVLLGLDGGRSDTMMFISFDPDEPQMDIISIPRDTYYPRKGYDGLGQKKINAAYAAHGAEGVKSIVSDLLYDVPVHYYVTLTYQGAASVVDAIGGVPMYIPQRMYYRDPYDSPPLVIDFAPGNHVLKGQDAVKFLRYRQAAPGSGAMDRNGDLGRVEAQQEFMKNAMKQAMSLGNLPTLASSAFRFVRTDVELQDLVRYANQARNMNPDTMTTFTLPGEARMQSGLSYFFHHGLETRQLLIHIYSNGEVTADLEEARRLEEEANGTADEEEEETETDSSNS
ncbi:cell envelope-related function transcriptional attenuator common domain-containing protein [Tindallia magadiensis]|uniref:Cell envelope-related function transcriptional attenuator common domain-containing protein n=1 Tax=Tindallia magadiensis TaxID=69895 RepID=A0A1I3CXS6_9FIRM|nr:cell envelope-related function transcriptional attenuator common domain-containing protein [Tindallia magadiensis]